MICLSSILTFSEKFFSIIKGICLLCGQTVKHIFTLTEQDLNAVLEWEQGSTGDLSMKKTNILDN